MFKKLFKFVLLAALLLSVIAFGIVIVAKPNFESTYQSVIKRKYNHLNEINDPKIVFVGGSSLAFGLDEERIEDELDIPVVNLGLHAGFGSHFNTEISKGNLNEGDIVILAHEYGWLGEDGFTSFGTDLAMTGIDGQPEMYQFVPINKYPSILNNLFAYGFNKLTRHDYAEGVYSSSAFNERGNMIYDRPSVSIDDGGTYKVGLNNGIIAKESLDYLKQYSDDLNNRGVSVYMTFPPFMKSEFTGTDEEFQNIVNTIEKETTITVISDYKTYLFDKSLMYDTVYHCNSFGSTLRTEKIIHDIKTHILNNEQQKKD